jgi:hypothetical protein
LALPCSEEGVKIALLLLEEEDAAALSLAMPAAPALPSIDAAEDAAASAAPAPNDMLAAAAVEPAGDGDSIVSSEGCAAVPFTATDPSAGLGCREPAIANRGALASLLPLRSVDGGRVGGGAAEQSSAGTAAAEGDVENSCEMAVRTELTDRSDEGEAEKTEPLVTPPPAPALLLLSVLLALPPLLLATAVDRVSELGRGGNGGGVAVAVLVGLSLMVAVGALIASLTAEERGRPLRSREKARERKVRQGEGKSQWGTQRDPNTGGGQATQVSV